jgi:uncharacterized protein
MFSKLKKVFKSLFRVFYGTKKQHVRFLKKVILNMSLKTLIVGASTNPSRYAYLAAERLLSKNHEIVLLGIKKGEVLGREIKTEWRQIDNQIHTVTLYIGPDKQVDLAEKIKKTGAKRVIFNPGTENEALKSELESLGLVTVEGCTLVMLGTGQYG